MQTWHCVLLVCLVTGAALASGDVPQPGAVEEWRTLVGQKGKALVFDVYGTPGPQWPKTVDIKSDQEKVRQVLAPMVIRETRDLVHGAVSTSEKQFWSRLDACLRIRSEALRTADYVAVVLADALTRGIAVALCEKLGCESGLSRPFQEALKRLQDSGLPVATWCAIAQKEFGVRGESLSEVPRVSTEEESLKVFWRVISSNDDFGIPANVEKSGSLDLLQSPSLPLLFHRTIQTDILVKTLAVTARYKTQTDDFSLEDGEQKVAKRISAPVPQTRYTIKKNAIRKNYVPLNPENFSRGERVLGLQISYPEVARLLHAIHSKTIERQLFYDVSDILPPRTE